MPKGSQINFRRVVAIALALASALLIAACGGGGGEDPQQVIDETFSNPTSIHSGVLDLDIKAQTSGGESPGTLEVKLGGRFQGQGNGRFPLFDFDLSLKAESGSQNISGSGGLTSTGDAAFVKVNGTEYSVPQQLYDEFVTSYSQLQGQNAGEGTGLLQRLDIDLANWLTDLKNEGTEDVEGTKTVHISGEANVPQVVEDLRTIARRAGSAVGNVDLARLARLNDVIQSGEVDVYSGEQDKLLRRLQLSFELEPPTGTPGAPDSLTFDLQLNFANLNKPQTIQAPGNAQPLENLLGHGGINLSDAIRGGLGTSGGLPESGGSTTAPSSSATQAYQQCLSQASGNAALQECAKLLRQ